MGIYIRIPKSKTRKCNHRCTECNAFKASDTKAPKVLTEEEIDEKIRAFGGECVFWVEDKTSVPKLYPVTLISSNPMRPDRNFFDLRTESYFTRNWLGRSWRCWDYKPTDKQLSATPWEEKWE